MAIFGWVILVVISCYASFCFVAGNIVSMGFSGNSMGKIANCTLVILLIALWYFVFNQFPFEVSVK